MRRYWIAGAGLALAAACCGLAALPFTLQILSPEEVRPPHPGFQGLSAHSAWTVSGRHTVREYRTTAEIREVIDWYRAEGGGATARVPPSAESRCDQDRLSTPRPDLPLARLWHFSRTTDVIYCPEGSSVRVTTDTYYRWELFGP